MKILSIEHAQLAMPRGEDDRARAFYCGVLNLVEVPKPADLAQRGGCWFKDGKVKLHLGVEDDFRPAKKAHVALVVEDLGGRLMCSTCLAIGWSCWSVRLAISALGAVAKS